MAGKKLTTKSKIVSAAWKLFYENGYDHTTVDQIIKESGTSKGTFYHYFNGKDGLLSSLSYLFDEKYEELLQEMDPEMDSFEKLMYLNQELFDNLEQVRAQAENWLYHYNHKRPNMGNGGFTPIQKLNQAA